MNLNEIKEALSKATQGKWEHHNWDVMEKPHVVAVEVSKNHRVCNGNADLPLTPDDAILIANAPEWLASLIEHYEEVSADAIVLHWQVEEMQKTIEAAYNIACEDFESVNQMELIRLTLGESLQSLKGDANE